MALLRWHRSGTCGWLLIGGAVLAWDLSAAEGETLSERFRGCWHGGQGGRAAIGAGWILVSAHLFGILPARIDPLRAIHVLRGHCRAAQCDPSADQSDLSAELKFDFDGLSWG